MRKLLLFGWLVLTAAAFAQPNNPTIQTAASSPSGNACAAGVPVLYYGGSYYGCDNTSHYGAIGGGGSGTVNSGTANQITYYAGTGTAVSGTNAIPNGTTATTQSQADASTKVATTAYVDTGLGGRAPSSGIALTALAAQAADTVVQNATGGSAVPTAVAMPTCTTGADLYNTSTHAWSCVGVGGSFIGYSGVNGQTANYVTILGDAGGYIRMNVASANTVTIPLNATVAYTVGTTITIIQVGAGQTTIAATGGVTINTPTSLAARAQWSTIMVTKVATDTWDAAGDLQ